MKQEWSLTLLEQPVLVLLLMIYHLELKLNQAAARSLDYFLISDQPASKCHVSSVHSTVLCEYYLPTSRLKHRLFTTVYPLARGIYRIATCLKIATESSVNISQTIMLQSFMCRNLWAGVKFHRLGVDPEESEVWFPPSICVSSNLNLS